MRVTKEMIENLSPEDVLIKYREASTSEKKQILKNDINLSELIRSIDIDELIELAKIHPYKQ